MFNIKAYLKTFVSIIFIPWFFIHIPLTPHHNNEFFPQVFNRRILHHLWGKKNPPSPVTAVQPASCFLPVSPHICLHFSTHIPASPECRASVGWQVIKCRNSWISYPVFVSSKQVLIFKRWIVPTILKVFDFRNSVKYLFILSMLSRKFWGEFFLKIYLFISEKEREHELEGQKERETIWGEFLNLIVVIGERDNT